ncbi:hypothetical protein BLNAU_19740 [Blattamonas nauphoetae]|uniref:Uncharacterized protein n=1 Tax=Blattamonas nauphoetae TaxID=2049346 RepID=A0ABQ9X0P9_9EUKA|nr:hypothetical protein BLNAU_19740 [Blattamonas nauphoetae]
MSHKLRQALTISIITADSWITVIHTALLMGISSSSSFTSPVDEQEQPELHLVCQFKEATTLLEVVTSLLSLSNVEILANADFSIATLLESSCIKIQSSILDFGREFT